MKHIQVISRSVPAKANTVQRIICQLTVSFVTLLSFGGGAFPILDFTVDKCDLPTPNDPA